MPLAIVQRTTKIGLAAVDLDAGVADFRGSLGKEERATAEKREDGEGKEGAEERWIHLIPLDDAGEVWSTCFRRTSGFRGMATKTMLDRCFSVATL